MPLLSPLPLSSGRLLSRMIVEWKKLSREHWNCSAKGLPALFRLCTMKLRVSRGPRHHCVLWEYGLVSVVVVAVVLAATTMPTKTTASDGTMTTGPSVLQVLVFLHRVVLLLALVLVIVVVLVVIVLLQIVWAPTTRQPSKWPQCRSACAGAHLKKCTGCNNRRSMETMRTRPDDESRRSAPPGQFLAQAPS